MAGRQFGAAAVGAIFGAMHYVLMAGEVADGAGLKKLPEPFPTFIALSLSCSILIIIGFVIPRALRLNIALSMALLKGVDRCSRVVDRTFDEVRRGLITIAENVASWLRKLDSPADQTGSER